MAELLKHTDHPRVFEQVRIVDKKQLDNVARFFDVQRQIELGRVHAERARFG
jgi:hypothetical protein